MSLEFRVILNIALRCPVLSVLHCLFFNSAALPSPVRNLYVITLPCATLNCLTITFLPCTALLATVQPCPDFVMRRSTIASSSLSYYILQCHAEQQHCHGLPRRNLPRHAFTYIVLIFLLLTVLDQPAGSGEEEDFYRVFTIYGHGGHLGHVTSIMSSDFHFLVP